MNARLVKTAHRDHVSRDRVVKDIKAKGSCRGVRLADGGEEPRIAREKLKTEGKIHGSSMIVKLSLEI